jgi:hypothetical protein
MNSQPEKAVDLRRRMRSNAKCVRRRRSTAFLAANSFAETLQLNSRTYEKAAGAWRAARNFPSIPGFAPFRIDLRLRGNGVGDFAARDGVLFQGRTARARKSAIRHFAYRGRVFGVRGRRNAVQISDGRARR